MPQSSFTRWAGGDERGLWAWGRLELQQRQLGVQQAAWIAAEAAWNAAECKASPDLPLETIPCIVGQNVNHSAILSPPAPAFRPSTPSSHAPGALPQATFDDSLHEEAVAKNHSTIGEAVAAGAAAGAYLTMLTHFSQRYPKLPVIDHNFIKVEPGWGSMGGRVGHMCCLFVLWQCTWAICEAIC